MCSTLSGSGQSGCYLFVTFHIQEIQIIKLGILINLIHWRVNGEKI